jgi:N-acetylated-alpha-linked acidic dipeptidase
VATTTNEIEQRVRSAVSADALQAHLEVFSTLFRDSGTEDEWKAARYIAEQLTSYGVENEIHELDSLISLPLDGRLAILDTEGNEVEEIPVRTRSFGAQTPDGGVEAELVFVPFAKPKPGEMIFSHRAVSADYSGLDVTGKIVITADGGPDGVRRAEERGAAGHIHIWPSDENVIHEMICTSIWGTPTPDSASKMPKIPVLGVKSSDGEKIEAMIANRPVRVRMESNVKTGWVKLPLVIGHIPGTSSEDFLLVGAHIDSWYEGVTDNATGDAALLEMARTLSVERDALRRGVRFGWWPGHSTGRYSGSTWYADNAFSLLREHAVGYLNIDSPGVRETSLWDCRYNMGEIEHITGSVVTELSGQEPNIRRPLRAGDQSFWGIGLPSMGAYRMLPADHPDRKAVGGSGGGYWWHSPEDTLDKADANILASDTEVYVTITLRMCSPEVIPYQFTRSAQDFVDYLTEYQQAAGGHLDLSDALDAADAFKTAAEKLDAAPVTDAEARNRLMLRLTRIVNPALFTVQGPYEMDPALQMPVLPGLAPAQRLPAMDASSDDYHFLRTHLVRQRNRVYDALKLAREVAEAAAR